MNLQNMKKQFRASIAMGLCLLTGASVFAQTLTPGTPAYINHKNNLAAPTMNVAPNTAAVNPLGVGTPPGCFFPPTTTGYTTLPGNDDGSTGLIALPFTFTMYGTAYTSCYINNNGNISFGSPTGTYTPVGFPSGTSLPMVAPFWADVYTPCDPAHVLQYKVESNRLICTWTSVEYFAVCGAGALFNTFQVIISDGTDPGIGLGNNVAFYYGDMQWTTGNASAGSGGFGGGAATVGINAGDGINFVQVGRFDNPTAAYDGPGNTNDGVNYLDYECFTFNVGGTAGSSNLPPSVVGAPSGNVINIPCGTTATLNLSFLPPEVAQTVSTLINTGGLCGTTINSNTSGSLSNTSVTIVGQACNAGTHHIIYTATDDAGIPASTVVDITVNITGCTSVPTISQWGLILLSLISLSFGMVFIYRRENAYAFAGSGSSSFRSKLFDKNLYLKVFAVVLGLAIAGLAASFAYFGSLTIVDTFGTIASAAVVAFMAQLYIRLRNSESN